MKREKKERQIQLLHESSAPLVCYAAVNNVGSISAVFSSPVFNLVPRVLRLLGQRFGRQERLWGNGIFSIFLIGYSGNNEIGEAEVGSMLTLPSIMSRTSQERSAIFQRGQQVTLLVRDWRISIHLQHLLVSAFG